MKIFDYVLLGLIGFDVLLFWGNDRILWLAFFGIFYLVSRLAYENKCCEKDNSVL